MLNNTQKALLAALASSEYFEYEEVTKKIFSNFAKEILESKDPVVQRSVLPLLGEKIHNNKITGIGKASVQTEISKYNDKNLSIQTLFHLKEVVKRNMLVKNSKTNKEGVLDYATDEMLKKLLEDVLDAVFDRFLPTNIENFITESSAAFATQLIAVYNSQQSNFVVESSATADDIVQEKPKKTKKTKSVKI